MISLGPSLLSAPPPKPVPVAIYYGYPSLVNGAKGDLEKAARAFSKYRIVVIGDGLEFPNHPDHGNVVHLLQRLKKSRVFGYICIGSSQKLPIDEVRRRILAWKQTGVNGIFLDEAGNDFDVSRERREQIIDIVHAANSSVFINAFQPSDVFANGTHLRRGDFFLLESFVVRNGKLDDSTLMNSRVQEAREFRNRYKVGLVGVTTTPGPFSPDLYRAACIAAKKASLDGVGWGEPNFSSSSNELSEVFVCRQSDPEGIKGDTESRVVPPTAGAQR
jgi:hypothetical protein